MGRMTRWPGRVLIPLLLLAGCAGPAHRERSWAAMGCQASAEVYTTTERDAGLLLDAIGEAVERVGSTMTLERPSSELNRLNAEASDGPYRLADRDLYRCIRLAVDYAKTSEGVFDPTVGAVTRLYGGPAPPPPAELVAAVESVGWSAVVFEREALAVRFGEPGMALDLGGVVHGYALDVAARNFARPGSRAGLLRLGHHVYAWGRPPDRPVWEVQLADPRSAGRPLVEVRVGTRGIALTGAREAPDAGGNPIVDPRNGRPAETNVLVAVAFADSAADADAVSTALYVGGSRRAGALLSKTRRVESILLVEGEKERYLIASASLDGRLKLSEELSREVAGQVRYLLPPARL